MKVTLEILQKFTLELGLSEKFFVRRSSQANGVFELCRDLGAHEAAEIVTVRRGVALMEFMDAFRRGLQMSRRILTEESDLVTKN